MRTKCVIKALLIAFVLFRSLSSSAQSNSIKGDKYFDQNLFESAIKHYQADARSRNKKVSEYAMQKLADCYRITGEFELAEETYRKILKKKKKDPVNVLNYGLSLKSSAKYAEAIVQFQEYVRLKPEDPMGNIFLMSCDSAQKWLDETIGREVKNMVKINSELSDFSPVFYSPKKIFFSSSRPGSEEALISFDGGAEIHRMDLYAVELKDIEASSSGKKDIVNFHEINTSLHEGSACFSANGKEIYFTKTVKGLKDRSSNSILNTLQVFCSYMDSTGKWSVPASAFAFNSLNYSVGHPSLSKDGKTIFYMSDKPGGFGKTDIYFSVKQQNGEWGPPVNAGNSVNTFGHELFPYISSSGELYFSSNAHPGMGQLDIFRSEKENGKWTKVRNLKPPINSIGNDFGITFDGDYQRGFFSSDRFNGKGAEDIYSFSEELPTELSFVNDSLTLTDYSVFDDIKYKLTNETDSVTIELKPLNGLLTASLKQNKKYLLRASRYGMKYNQVRFDFSKDTIEKSMVFNINVLDKPLRMSGCFFIGLNAGELKRQRTDAPFTPGTNVSFNETEASVNKLGFFAFRSYMEPGRQNTINSKNVISDKEIDNKE